MDLLDILKPNSKMAPPGTDPLAMPGNHRRAGGPNKLLLIGAIVGFIAFMGLGVWGIIRPKDGNASAQGQTSSPTATQSALPNPGVATQFNATATPGPTGSATLITGAGLLTQYASSQTATASPTASPTVEGTSCAASGEALTEIACNGQRLNETLQAAQPGTPISASGIDLGVTTVYVYPTPYPPTQTPWIIQASATQTPVVITATQGPTQTPWIQVTVITAVPGPTQTPWFYITQPPVVTVMWTQLVTVIVPVTVVVTATPTDTPQPSDTPQPTETPSS